MRRRNSGRRAMCTISAISSLPPWSRGWALPAKTNCTGRSLLLMIAVSRSRLRKISVPRL